MLVDILNKKPEIKYQYKPWGDCKPICSFTTFDSTHSCMYTPSTPWPMVNISIRWYQFPGKVRQINLQVPFCVPWCEIRQITEPQIHEPLPSPRRSERTCRSRYFFIRSKLVDDGASVHSRLMCCWVDDDVADDCHHVSRINALTGPHARQR